MVPFNINGTKMNNSCLTELYIKGIWRPTANEKCPTNHTSLASRIPIQISSIK